MTMKQRRSSSHESLFFDGLPLAELPGTASPLVLETDLKAIMRGKHVWVIGESKAVRERLDKAIALVKTVARSYKDTFLSLDDAHSEKVSRFLRHIGESDSMQNVLILAEDAYGHAYNKLCRLHPSPMLALCPRGELAVIFPGSTWAGHGTAKISIDAIKLALCDTKIVIICEASQYRYCLAPRLNDAGLTPAAIVDLHPDQQGTIIDGMQVHPLSRISQLKYDAVIIENNTKDAILPKLHTILHQGTLIIGVDTDLRISNTARISYSHPTFSRKDGIYNNGMGSRHTAHDRASYKSIFKNSPFIDMKGHHETISQKNGTWALHALSIGAAPAGTSVFKNGIRHTTHQPDVFDNSIYIFGRSHVFGTKTDEPYTITSCLQRLCNSEFERKTINNQYIVHNLGVIQNSNENIVQQFMQIEFTRGDICLILDDTIIQNISILKYIAEQCRKLDVHFALFFWPNLRAVPNLSRHEKRILNFFRIFFGTLSSSASQSNIVIREKQINSCTANDIPIYDLQPFFNTPHPGDEYFLDHSHVTYKGYEVVSGAVFNSFIRHLGQNDTAEVPEKCLNAHIALVRRVAKFNRSILEWLEKSPRHTALPGEKIGCIVMNCNPFTLGHRHILREALNSVDKLYLFVVEEDRSVFSFKERWDMIVAGTEEFRARLHLVPSGTFIISSQSFPEYFTKDCIDYAPDATNEILIFGTAIAPALGITTRIFGEEPFCAVTRAYHQQIKELLPKTGIEYLEIPRLQLGDTPISASRVRLLLDKGDFTSLAEFVPLTTLKHLIKRWVKQERPD